MKALRQLAWNGIPSVYRTDVWQLLLGYVPTHKDRRGNAMIRKRKEYLQSIPLYFNMSDETDRTTQDGEILRQIRVDMPRTCPNTPFFHQIPIRNAMERILYIWSIRHPASGYVQGMNDLVTPLFLVCIQVIDSPSVTAFHRSITRHMTPLLYCVIQAVRNRCTAMRCCRVRTWGLIKCRGRHLLVPVQAPGQYTGPLHKLAARSATDDSSVGGSHT